MKPVDARNPIGLDRLATWNEVMCAIAALDQGACAPVGDKEDLRVTDSDFSGVRWELSEDTLWLAIVSEMPDSKSN
jgi:hypothetical protein